MEASSGTEIAPNRSLSKRLSSSSFSLRCASLNSLRLRRIFDLFDKNGDAMITVEELGQALGLLGLEVDFSELDFTVKSFIQPDNIGLRFEDFQSLHQSLNDTYFGMEEESPAATVESPESEKSHGRKMSQEESDLSEAFKVFDEDGDGFISAQELQVVLGKLGFAEGNEIDRVQKMITSVDRNHDGRVDFFEFKDMMRSVLVRSA